MENMKKIRIKKQIRLKSERNNIFLKQINKIPLSSNDDKRMQPIHSVETYEYGINQNLAYKNE